MLVEPFMSQEIYRYLIVNKLCKVDVISIFQTGKPGQRLWVYLTVQVIVGCSQDSNTGLCWLTVHAAHINKEPCFQRQQTQCKMAPTIKRIYRLIYWKSQRLASVEACSCSLNDITKSIILAVYPPLSFIKGGSIRHSRSISSTDYQNASPVVLDDTSSTCQPEKKDRFLPSEKREAPFSWIATNIFY